MGGIGSAGQSIVIKALGFELSHQPTKPAEVEMPIMQRYLLFSRDTRGPWADTMHQPRPVWGLLPRDHGLS
jgi:hypothetical protein